MAYNFKNIEVVPASSSLVDIVLSKTQRKTPTVTHQGYEIQRIRKFYMRKIKFTQQTIHEKLAKILDTFPKLDDLHPFYADLMNVLYDKDHYKIALGQVSKAQGIIDSIAKDYVRMIKYADSLYRCKTLKRTSLGRMCTVLKKLNASFGYLEEVRRHLARLPSIDPTTRTLILTGFPNVGKSSLMNNLTKANVDVQPYPFTTQSLFVGHTLYKCVPWQILDTPGILDHPLEQRNTIEMQAVTALAHLNACVLFVIDISETCGYFLEKQISLFHSIKPLFKNKPIVVVLSKTDLKKWENLSPEAQQSIEAIAREQNAYVISMSNKNGEGIDDLKSRACDILLDFRFSQKSENAGKMRAIENRLHVAIPQKRDNIERPPQIPESVLAARQKMESGQEGEEAKGKTVKDAQEEEGGAGVYYVHPETHFQLEDEDWRYDAPPEIFEGKNVADYIDPEIETKLLALEKEEDILEQMEPDQLPPKTEEEKELEAEYKKVQGKKKVLKEHHKMKLHDRVHKKAKKIDEVKKAFEKKGMDPTTIESAVAKRTKLVEKAKKRLNPDQDNRMEDIDEKPVALKRKAVEKAEKMGFSRAEGMDMEKSVADKLRSKIDRKWKVNFKQPVHSTLPKHLNSGKMGLGTRNKRQLH
eukprot:TRINITY_DN914_c0_g1_i1.p2 TRINITY_DN914_c0_g1~~TRINITY_DN914_c0_g1_i1.p2  ORF type:complete len:641 (+),score=107.04 TRINITY_DN914_c0_g1_i1:3845-5767(+)